MTVKLVPIDEIPSGTRRGFYKDLIIEFLDGRNRYCKVEIKDKKTSTVGQQLYRAATSDFKGKVRVRKIKGVIYLERLNDDY